jgi:hypothetical protein
VSGSFEAATGPGGRADHQVEGGLQFPSQRGPDVGEGSVLRGWEGHRDGDRQAELCQRPGEQVVGEGLMPKEAGQERREQAVLILGALGPGGHEVGELEEARREVPRGNALLCVVLVEKSSFPTTQILSDVVEVDIDGGRVSPPGPFLRRGVEHDLDVSRPGCLSLDERKQRRVHLMDHPTSLSSSGYDGEQGPVRPTGTDGCPYGQRGVHCNVDSRNRLSHGSITRLSSDEREGFVVTDPVLRIEPSQVSIQPGGEARIIVTIFNPGTVVEGYVIDVVAAVPIPWAEVQPPTVSVYPQQEATAVIVFSPPSGPGAPGGVFPFGVRARSQIEGGGSAVVEGDLEIGAVSGLQAKLTPLASTGRWSGRHTLQIHNGGNAPARLRLTAESPDQALGFLVSPAVLEVPLGGEATARLKVRTRHPVLRGTPQRLPFQVACEPDSPVQVTGQHPTMSTPERPVVDGAFNQKPILTRAVVAVAGLVVVAAIAGIAYALLKSDPTTAEEAKPPDAPTGLAVVADPETPGFVTLTWDEQSEVDSYVLLQTLPNSDSQPVDPPTNELRLRVETAEEYCYQIEAVREGAANSAPSDPPACATTTLPPDAKEPTASPTIDVIPPDGGGEPTPTTSSPTSPSTSAPTSPTGTAPTPADEPLGSIAELTFLVGLDQAEVENRRQAFLAAGIAAEILNTDDWVLEPPTSESGTIIYVDGATREDAQAACEAAEASQPDLVTSNCVLFHQVSPPQ